MSGLSYDTILNNLLQLGAPRWAAEATALREAGPPPDPKAVERDARILEDKEQAAIIKLFREHGFKVRSTSQKRASKIALGFPDLFVTHKTLPIAFFFETKRQVGGVISEAQQEFGDDCWRCGVRWFAGDRYEAATILRVFELG